jgi:hypothetical protein
MNYRFAGHKYRNAMKRLFGETVEEEDMFARLRTPEQQAEYEAAIKEIWGQIEVKEMVS